MPFDASSPRACEQDERCVCLESERAVEGSPSSRRKSSSASVRPSWKIAPYLVTGKVTSSWGCAAPLLERWSSEPRGSRCCCICRRFQGMAAATRKTRARTCRTRRRGGTRCDRAGHGIAADAAATLIDVGSGCRDESARTARDRHRVEGVLLRPTKSLAAGDQREYQRTAEAVLPKGNGSQHLPPVRSARGGACIEHAAEEDTQLAHASRSIE